MTPQLNSNTAFVSLLITIPAYRKRGLAQRLFADAMGCLHHHNVLLHSVPSACSFYARRGFHEGALTITKLRGNPNLTSVVEYRRQNACTSRPVTSAVANLDAVLAYDARVHGYDRRDVIGVYLASPEVHARYVPASDNAVSGYIMLHKLALGYKVCGLYADDIATAKTLLYETLWLHNPDAEPVAVDTLNSRQEVTDALLNPLGEACKNVVSYDRLMYNKNDVCDVDMSCVMLAMTDSATIV